MISKFRDLSSSARKIVLIAIDNKYDHSALNPKLSRKTFRAAMIKLFEKGLVTLIHDEPSQSFWIQAVPPEEWREEARH